MRYVIMLKYCNVDLYVSEIYPTSRELIDYLDDMEEIERGKYGRC